MDSHIQKKYEVEKRLGKGAYGIVWKATSKRWVTSLVPFVRLSKPHFPLVNWKW